MKYLYSCLALMACALGLGCGFDPSTAQFRGSKEHVGVYPAPEVLSEPTVLWVSKADGPISSTAVLSEGILLFGTQTGLLRALDSKTGTELWQFKIERSINSSPAVSQGLVIFQGNDGFTYALDTKTGKERWKVDMGPDITPTSGYDYLSSSPVVFGDKVYIGGNNGNLYAIDTATGNIVWKVDAIGPNSVRSSPAIYEDLIYFTTGAGLFAFDLKTGAKKWEYQSLSITRGSPAVSKGIVVFGDSMSTIHGVNANDGGLKWKYKIDYYWISGTPAIADGTVYLGGDDSKVNALDLETGAIKWRFETRGETIWSSPVSVGNLLYIGDWNFSNKKNEAGSFRWGYLYGIDRKTGKELWHFETKDNIVASPVVGNDGTIFIGSTDGFMYAVR